MKKSLWFLLLLGTCVAFAGCGRDTMPPTFVLAGGEVERSHPKPMEGGYYSDWDPYAGSIEITPVKDVNPVQTQHVFIATVRDKDGELLPLRRVEWMIAEIIPPPTLKPMRGRIRPAMKAPTIPTTMLPSAPNP